MLSSVYRINLVSKLRLNPEDKTIVTNNLWVCGIKTNEIICRVIWFE